MQAGWRAHIYLLVFACNPDRNLLEFISAEEFSARLWPIIKSKCNDFWINFFVAFLKCFFF